MLTAEAESKPVPIKAEKQHAAFFRQSGWLMIATVAAGLMSWAVHFLNKKIPDAEYSIFVTLLMTTACIPTVPLQMVFAQQSAQALAMNRERQLAGMMRLAWLGTFVLWVVAALVILMFQGRIVERWQLPNASGLWVMLPVMLASLWVPLFSGVLQGRQDFFWLGWAAIIGAVGRFAASAIRKPSVRRCLPWGPS